MGLRKIIKKNIVKLKYINFFKQTISNKKIIITGTNSGIGLELVKNLSKKNQIIAMINKNSSELEKLKSENIKILKCNFNKLDKIDELKNEIEEFNPNILINNASFFGGDNQNIEKLDFEIFFKTININSFAPIKMIKLCLNSKNLEQINTPENTIMCCMTIV